MMSKRFLNGKQPKMNSKSSTTDAFIAKGQKTLQRKAIIQIFSEPRAAVC